MDNNKVKEQDIINLKKKYKDIVLKVVIFYIIATIYLVFKFLNNEGVDRLFPFFILILVNNITIVIVLGLNKKYTDYIKRQIKKYNGKYIKEKFPVSTLIEHEGIPEYYIVNTNLLKHESMYESKNRLYGRYKDTFFQCADLLQQEMRGYGENRHAVTLFEGRYYEFTFNKSFKYDLLITQPKIINVNWGYKKINTESINFNSELSLYVKDEYEAFYLLTPQIIEALVDLDNKYNDLISFSFNNDKLSILIDNRELGLLKSIIKRDNTSKVNNLMHETDDIKEFIDKIEVKKDLFK